VKLATLCAWSLWSEEVVLITSWDEGGMGDPSRAIGRTDGRKEGMDKTLVYVDNCAMYHGGPEWRGGVGWLQARTIVDWRRFDVGPVQLEYIIHALAAGVHRILTRY